MLRLAFLSARGRLGAFTGALVARCCESSVVLEHITETSKHDAATLINPESQWP